MIQNKPKIIACCLVDEVPWKTFEIQEILPELKLPLRRAMRVSMLPSSFPDHIELCQLVFRYSEGNKLKDGTLFCIYELEGMIDK